MTQFVLDAESLAMAQAKVWPANKTLVLNAITADVQAGGVGFPPQVLKEARRLADPEHDAWIFAVSSGVKWDIPFQYVMEANSLCPDLVDAEVGYSAVEDSAIHVVAAGLWLAAQGQSTVIVSDEVDSPPHREGLVEACVKASLISVTFDMYIDQLPGCSAGMVR